MTKIGIDIGTYSIKCVVLKKVKNKTIIKHAKTYLINGNLFDFIPKAVKMFKKEFNIHFSWHYITISLSSPSLITRIFDTSIDSLKDLRKSIKFEIEEKTQIKNLDNYYYKWDAIDIDEGFRVFSSVIKKKIINDLKLDNIKLFEPQIVSLSRLIEDDSAIIDLGHSATRFYIFKKGMPFYSQTIDIGGLAFTEKITQNIQENINNKKELFLQANNLKHENAKILFDNESAEDNQTNRSIFNYIANDVENLGKELKQALRTIEVKSNIYLDKIYYTGSNSNLKGLTNYLSSILLKDLIPLNITKDSIEDDLALKKGEHEYAIAASSVYSDKFTKINFSNSKKLNYSKAFIAALVFLLVSQTTLWFIHDKHDQLIEELYHHKSQISKNILETELLIDAPETHERFQANRNVEQILKHIENKNYLSKYLYNIPPKIPEGITIKDLYLSSTGNILIGQSENYSQIAYLAIELEKINKTEIRSIDKSLNFVIIVSDNPNMVIIGGKEEVSESDADSTPPQERT